MTQGVARGQDTDDNVISYEDAKQLARDPNVVVRADLARRPNIRREVLYFLAEDQSPEVRREIAANSDTPAQADLLLASDDDEGVRQGLAAKVSQLRPDFDPQTRDKAQLYVVKTLEALARDQAVRVREILADTLKSVANAPVAVIQTLARDEEDVVACPILEFSPLLCDADLMAIIEEGCTSGRLLAISQREELSPDICDAIVDRDERDIVAALLSNNSAQIREDTLDQLVDRAPQEINWHKPLVDRPGLSLKSVRELASFVTDTLLTRLELRGMLDEETAQIVEAEVHRRAQEVEKRDQNAAETVERLHKSGELGEDDIHEALVAGERGFVRHALALLAGSDTQTVIRILESRSAKGITSLAWKAGMTMRMAIQLQRQLGGIPPGNILNAREGLDYPLTDEELQWQWEFFASAAP